MKKLWGVALIFALAGCRADLPAPKGKVLSEDSTLQPIDPGLARASVTAASLSGVSGSTTFKVPSFQISLTNADYVEVVRCVRSYKLTAPSGKTFEEIGSNEPTRRENLRYALVEAKANQNACRILGTYVIRNSFQDLTAINGDYYYIVNPCVQQERSTVSNVNCSYELAVTGPIVVTGSSISADFVSAASELATAEAKLSATMQRMYRRVELMKAMKDACEINYFTEAANNQIFKAVLNVAVMGLQAVSNVVFTGVGGTIASSFLGNLRTAFATAPGPQYQCPQYEAERAAGAEEFKLLEPQLKVVSDARAKMSTVNAEFKRLDEAILTSVRQN